MSSQMVRSRDGMRFRPAGPVSNYRSYRLARPRQTHMRQASCEEVGCRARLQGWTTMADESTPAGQRIAHYIRGQRQRKYCELRSEAGTTLFVFPPGQECFGRHLRPIERLPRMIVRDGDWRGNPTGWRREHTRAEDWIDDMSTHLDQLRERQRRG